MSYFVANLENWFPLVMDRIRSTIVKTLSLWFDTEYHQSYVSTLSKWLNGRVPDLRSKFPWFKPHQKHSVASMSKDLLVVKYPTFTINGWLDHQTKALAYGFHTLADTVYVNTSIASANFHHLLVTFANSLGPFRRSWFGSKLFDTLIVFMKENFEKKSAGNKKYAQHCRDKWIYTSLTNFSTKYLRVCKVYTDVGGIK